MTKTDTKMKVTAMNCVGIIFAGISHIIFNLFYTVQPNPYLDEIFHIPQAMKYCKGLFHEWDPKITTLPGLYILSLGILKPVSWILGGSSCGVYALRYINFIACVLNFFLFVIIQAKLQHFKKEEDAEGEGAENKQDHGYREKEQGHGIREKRQEGNNKTLTAVEQPTETAKSRGKSLKMTLPEKVQKKRMISEKLNALDIRVTHQELLSAINLATFPVLYFFTFLYYTDTVSTSFVLLMYWLHLDSCHVLASAAGLMSVFIRQTNILWVGFMALDTLAQVLKAQVILRKKKVPHCVENNISYIQVLLETLFHVWNGGVTSWVAFVFSVIHQLWSYAVVFVCFILFVFLNGGLVVGDKLAHEVVVHVPQLMYFLMFSTFFCLPYFVSYIRPFFLFFNGNKKMVFFFILICVFIVYFNTLVHPYLLADNRHYTFYLWKRLYERHYIIKYLLIPLYLFGMFSMYQVLKENSIIFQLSYLLCVVLCLVPQKLLEFRYFIIPYLLFRLQINRKLWWQVIIEFSLFFCVNTSTIYIFLTRVFYWKDTPEVQRFMW